MELASQVANKMSKEGNEDLAILLAGDSSEKVLVELGPREHRALVCSSRRLGTLVEERLWRALRLENSKLGQELRATYPVQYGWAKTARVAVLRLQMVNGQMSFPRAIQADQSTLLLKKDSSYEVFNIVTGEKVGDLHSGGYYLAKDVILRLTGCKFVLYKKFNLVKVAELARTSILYGHYFHKSSNLLVTLNIGSKHNKREVKIYYVGSNGFDCIKSIEVAVMVSSTRVPFRWSMDGITRNLALMWDLEPEQIASRSYDVLVDGEGPLRYVQILLDITKDGHLGSAESCLVSIQGKNIKQGLVGNFLWNLSHKFVLTFVDLKNKRIAVIRKFKMHIRDVFMENNTVIFSVRRRLQAWKVWVIDLQSLVDPGVPTRSLHRRLIEGPQ